MRRASAMSRLPMTLDEAAEYLVLVRRALAERGGVSATSHR
jgi:hypothetical protein